jgi:hypothetical protein
MRYYGFPYTIKRKLCIPVVIGFLSLAVSCGSMYSDLTKSITSNEFTSFSFPAIGASGVFGGNNISVTVPYDTDVTALIATFTTTGVSVDIGGMAQVSGTTANSFTSPVTYTVHSVDGDVRNYTVTVTIALNTAKDITSFSFTTALNITSGVSSDCPGTIAGASIAVTVPYGTDVTSLIATFATTGVSVDVSGTAQVSDTTANNFTSPVIYTVHAADGSTANYTVTVTVALNPAKDITSFSFTTVLNLGAGVTSDCPGTISGSNIAVTVPYDTDVTSLTATFTTTGASVDIGGTAQVSGTTANNFTSPVTYTVHAADGTTANYTVTVTVALNPAKDITNFSFTSALNNTQGVSSDCTGTITGTNIAVTVPYGTDVTSLIATFATTGVSVDIGGTAQVSGGTTNNFTSPVIYTVHAADGSTQNFTVTVTVSPNPAKDITSFMFKSSLNGSVGVASDRTGTITGTNIAVTVLYGTNVTDLIATFATTGISVDIGGTAQVSDGTHNDFTSPVTYTVHAADGSTQNYTVTVTVVDEGWYTFLGGSGIDYAYSTQQTSDDGYIVAGNASANIPALQGKTPVNAYAGSNDIFIVKLDLAGMVFWYTFLGSSGSDFAASIQQTSDGGFIVAGSASSDIPTLDGKTPVNSFAGNADLIVVKLDSTGHVSWYTFLGSSTGSEDASCVRQTSDGGFIIAGSANADISTLQGKTPVNSYSASYDGLVVKLDSTGSVSWYTFLGGSGMDTALSILQASDGGYAVAGNVDANFTTLQGKTPLNAYSGSNDCLVVKLDVSGNVSWYTFLGGSGIDQAKSIQQTTDSGYVIAGNTYTNIPTLQGKTPLNAYSGIGECLVVKLDVSGNVSWYTFLGSGSGSDLAYAIQQTLDGGFIVAASASANIPTLQGKTPLNAYSGSVDCLVLKLDISGNVSWYTIFGGSGYDYAKSIRQTSEGGYIVAGHAEANIASLMGRTPLNPYSAGSDWLIVKLKGDGTM